MTKITKPWIKLLDYVSDEDYTAISNLADVCVQYDLTALKLELDYKLAMAKEKERTGGLHEINEFMYFDGEKLIGYIGIGCFGGAGSTPEINGMVHPAYRRQGIFRKLHQLTTAELTRRGIKRALLLCDGKSMAGKSYISTLAAKHDHAEFEMYVQREAAKKAVPPITLRKTSNCDAKEIARQNAIYFGDEMNVLDSDEGATNHGLVLPEEEEKRGMTIYLAYAGEEIIGKVHAQINKNIGGIYGLGVLPAYRGRGYGRALLLQGIAKLRETGAEQIMLQVVTENANALHLYESCGFVTTSTMMYYELQL